MTAEEADITTIDHSRSLTPEQVHAGTGAFLGSAIGDALGAPFEFGSAGDYASRFPQPVLGGTGEMCGGGHFDWEPGEFTDDTQMALCLAESLVACGGLDPADVWARWHTWAKSAPDVGSITRAALRPAQHVGAAERAEHCARTKLVALAEQPRRGRREQRHVVRARRGRARGARRLHGDRPRIGSVDALRRAPRNSPDDAHG